MHGEYCEQDIGALMSEPFKTSTVHLRNVSGEGFLWVLLYQTGSGGSVQSLFFSVLSKMNYQHVD